MTIDTALERALESFARAAAAGREAEAERWASAAFALVVVDPELLIRTAAAK